MTRVAILGSTGSIGRSALSVARSHHDRVDVVALAAGRNVTALQSQLLEHRPRLVTVASEESRRELKGSLPSGRGDVEIGPAGPDGLMAVATHPEADVVLCATSGTSALEAVLAAIEAGKTVALANKEVLVMAGALMMRAADRSDALLLPVDSEHNAIHQCLHGRAPSEVKRLVLTASGGPFRRWPADKLHTVTPAQALEHPTWSMGRKITIDSATLMNKGLEVIEARWLFDVGPERIDVVVHPQSVVHSLVELRDGSVIAQLGITDMRLPIQYAFSYPDRWSTTLPSLDLVEQGALEFDRPDTGVFPCLKLAYQALRSGPAYPAVLNAANEVAVHAFLDGRLPFMGIPRIIEQAMEAAAGKRMGEAATLEDVRGIDAWARRLSEDGIGRVESKERAG